MDIVQEKHPRGVTRFAVFDEGRDVSHVYTWVDYMYYGNAVLKAGVVGHVFTDDAYRGRGLAKLLMLKSFDWMAKMNCDIAFLYGIPVFYERLGYATIFPYHSCFLDSWHQQVEAVTGYHFRKYRRQDLDGVMAVYRKENAGQTGSYRRNKRYWQERSVKAGLVNSYVSLDTQKRVRAYAMIKEGMFPARFMSTPLEKESLPVVESGAMDVPSAQALVHGLQELGKRNEMRYSLLLSPPSRLCAQVIYHHGGRLIQAQSSGGMQARFIKFDQSMQTMKRSWQENISCSAFARTDAALKIATDRGKVLVTVKKGVCSVASSFSGSPDLTCTAQELIAMLFNYPPPTEPSGLAGSLFSTICQRGRNSAWAMDERFLTWE